MDNANLALRILKIFVLFAAALFGFFVFLGNILDYDSNYQFVRHVLSMDTTFEGNNLMWRAIESSDMHTFAYWLLIIAECVFSILGFIGVCKMVKALKAPAKQFNRAKAFGYYTFIIGVTIWFIGFIVIGSEWFAMWQSSIWNGKQTAMDIVGVWCGFFVLFALRDGELED
ncbi:DUF2165 family protein [Solibacillus sp. FSL H8-0538]|uniref:DUF2165 family protein n=1 Tax=Solibacillus sp. FSL H8-0538 TaxID=2921400 RepID=UPI0030FB9E6D